MLHCTFHTVHKHSEDRNTCHYQFQPIHETEKRAHLRTPHTPIQTNFQHNDTRIIQWHSPNSGYFFYCYRYYLSCACDGNTKNNISYGDDDGGGSGVDVQNACKMCAVNFLFICLIILCVRGVGVCMCVERNTNTN